MNKTTYVSKGFFLLVLLLSMQLFAQLAVPFSPRLDGGSIKVKGDIILIGNGIVTAKDLPLPYNGNGINNNNEGVYINAESGGDTTIFSSSSADLATNNSCKTILYAGLYWASVYPLEVADDQSLPFSGTQRIEDWNQIKFKLPTGGFIDLEADNNADPAGEEDDIIFDGYEYYGSGVTNSFKDSPIICYKNVTNLLQGLTEADGKYTVANLRATRGYRNGGCSAGWTLVVVYESPILPSKFISVFDGYAGVQNTTELNIPVSGFQTLPAPLPVNSNIGVAALEGDIGIKGDSFQFKASTTGTYTVLSDILNEASNFFNSSVTLNGVHVTNRNPASLNTLGLDINNFRLPNPLNSVLPNDATAGDLKLTTNGDGYGVFLTSFAVEIIEPDIVLTKVVEDVLGNDISDQLVDLGDELNYVLGFQNKGNDDATNLIIRDILPINIVFDYPSDIGLLPLGVSVLSYDSTTRELIFSVDNSVVEEDDPLQEIRFKVTVVSTCSLLTDACSNIISNQAYVTYNGTINSTFVISDDPSFSSNTGCLLTPAATNFLADINCTFEEEVILCGASTVLTSGGGYDSYSWSTSPTGTPVIGTTQSITITETGTYYVSNTAVAPCQSTEQVFEVITFGADVTNPVIPYADQVVICPNDGKELPNIFLCGGNGPRLIETNITDTTSIIWEQLDESSCTAVANLNCANEDAACTWNQVETGPNYLAETAGQYRLTLNYDGGCFNQFYFNVYSNLLVPTVNSRDIYCTTPGEIVVGSVPNGYEFSIDDINYQTSNTFSVNTAGIYTVYIKQIGVDPNPCVFTVPDVQIRQTDFTVSTTISQPLCNGDLGSVNIAANDVRPQYYFSISEGGIIVNSVGPITPNDYTFSNLNPGNYTIDVSTEDGCVYSRDIEIIEPDLLEATSALTTPLTCTDGEITVYPIGGTAPYFYFVNGASDFQTIPTIPVISAGVFNIRVVDSNNCTAETSITVDAILAPDFTINATDIACSDTGDVGTITFNVTNPNGNTLVYSIDNGVTFSNSNVFTGLAEGTYQAIIQYNVGLDVCTTTPQTIVIDTLATVTGTATLTTPYSCISNGIITVSGVTGGDAPYTYSLDGVSFQTGTTFTGLTEGTYTVSIRDSSGCAFIAAPITIAALNPPTDMDFSSTALSCPALTSDVTITTTGGLPILEYQIITPLSEATAYQTSNVFLGLSPNTYTFQVRDADGCDFSETYTIEPLPAITLSTVITKTLDCTLSPDGIITGTISGGTAPFTYAVSFNGGAYSGLNSVTGTSFTHTATTDGTYQFQITDVNGCISESAVQTINAISLPEIISVVQTNSILCHGDSNAAIDITINNTVGTTPFVINVNNDTNSTDYGTQTSSLPAGVYTITLTDANSCMDTDTITIIEPTPIDFSLVKVDITCNNPGGSSLGSITIQNVTGGTAPFTYFIANNFGDVISGNPYSATTNENHTFNIINFGTYTITAVDANGCSFSRQEVIASPPSDLLIDVATVVPNCTTGGTAVVEAVSALGSGNYEFAILEFNTLPYALVTSYLPPDVGFPNQRTFTNLTPGVVYTFVVHDLNTDCYFVKSADAAIAPASTLTSTVVPNNVICQGEDNGSVTFTIDDFDTTTTSVDYEIFTAFTNVLIDGPTNVVVTFGTPETVTIPTPGNLSPGQYYIRFTENGTGSFNGCESASGIFEIRESAVALNVTASVNKLANCNPNSGIISAIATNGTPPYVYQLTTSATPPLATDSSWAFASTFNADANSYFIHVKDTYGCIDSTPVIVLPLDPEPVIAVTINNQCTVTEGNFEIDVTLTTVGVAPYSYSIDGGAFQTNTAPFTVSNLASGIHTVEVQDVNGCGNLVSIDIESPIEIIPAITTLPTCNNDDGIITITGSGGTGAYTYSISPNPASILLTGNAFSGVPSGAYMITITDTATTCSEDVTVVIPEAIPPTFTTSPTQITCFGDNNGTFEINVSGYSGTYTYEVFDSTSTSVFGVVSANTSTNPELVTGLLAGTYSVVITESANPFCSAASSVIIPSPSEALDLNALETSSVTCDDDKGTITATATGGWGTYDYELTGTASVAYSSSGTFTNLSEGLYTVNVRDAGGCIDSENISLVLPTPIDATITATPSLLSCFGDTNATISVSAVTGGETINYSYTLNMISPTVSSSGPQTSPDFNNLGAGIYNVVVTDGFNCEFTSADVIITQPTEVEVSLIKATSQTCTTQTTLTLRATGGTGTYEYSDTASFTSVVGFTTSVTFPVSTGTYSYYVRDANGCSSTVSNEIANDPLPTLAVSLDTTNTEINCAGDDNGTIIASAEGGLGNYVYTLQDASGSTITPVTQFSPGVFTNLPVGNYQVEVISGDCLEVSAMVPITNASSILDVTFNPIDVTCNGENDGMLEITTSGGSGIIKYAISPQLDQFFDVETVENLSPGNYDVVVQDEKGCYVTHNFDIDQPAPLGFTYTIISEAPCDGDSTGEFTIEILGGEPPYSVSLDDITYTPLPLGTTTFTFEDLEGGEKMVYILDSGNCGGDSPFSIPLAEPVILDPLANIDYECINDTISNTNTVTNSVTVTVDSSITDTSVLEYALDGSAFASGTGIFENLSPGDHFIEVRHPNGCVQITDNGILFEIETFQPLTLALEDGGINEIVATVTGGEAPYEFLLNGESKGNESTFFIFESRDYTITVIDANGCEVSVTRFFEYIDVCIPNYFTPNNDNVLDYWEPGCADQYRNLTFDIFDRYGRKIATLKIGDKWDGKYKGIELPSGDYWYVVKLNEPNDKREFVGHFTLYR